MCFPMLQHIAKIIVEQDSIRELTRVLSIVPGRHQTSGGLIQWTGGDVPPQAHITDDTHAQWASCRSSTSCSHVTVLR
jgi:hypothetical protein